MSIFKRECFIEYLYKRRFCKKTFDNHLDRKQWIFKANLDSRYLILNQSK